MKHLSLRIILIISFIAMMISCNTINCIDNNEIENENCFIPGENSNTNNGEININIVIKETENITFKLIMIPPDSGLWIHGKDTIHIDSINEYQKTHICNEECK